MYFRSSFPAAWLGILLMAYGAARAEDPFLGQIKEIKCVNCKPGWVTLVVHDPIDTRDFELYLKDSDYNKIITPLPGKRIHDRNGECFYWMQRPKAKAGSKPASSPVPGSAPAPDASKPAGAGPGKAGKADDAKAAGKAAPDSVPPAGTLAAGEAAFPAALPLEEQGTPSTCIRFYRQMH